MNGILFQQDPSLYLFGVAARNFSLRLKRSLTQGGVLSKEDLSNPKPQEGQGYIFVKRKSVSKQASWGTTGVLHGLGRVNTKARSRQQKQKAGSPRK